MVGIEHKKTRRFRYPFWKYVSIDDYKTIVCICKNCNMKFYGELAKNIPLSIPIRINEDDFYAYSVFVSVNGKQQAILGTMINKKILGSITQEIINYRTRDFIEKIQ